MTVALIQKQLHVDKDNGQHAQSLEYAYNIRGWLESINDPNQEGPTDALSPADLFGMKLIYEQPIPEIPATN